MIMIYEKNIYIIVRYDIFIIANCSSFYLSFSSNDLFSLESRVKMYKTKIYNPGSPAPNPLKNQFSNFPSLKNKTCQEFTSHSPDPKNPLKVTFSCVKKRKSRDEDSEEDMSSPKKAKIDPQKRPLATINSSPYYHIFCRTNPPTI